MVISLKLAEWILSALIQAQAAILGFNLATIGIVVVFLYREGQFKKHADKNFACTFPKFRRNIKISFVLGVTTLLMGMIGLITIEAINLNLERIMICIFNSGLFFGSTIFAILAGFSILTTIDRITS